MYNNKNDRDLFVEFALVSFFVCNLSLLCSCSLCDDLKNGEKKKEKRSV